MDPERRKELVARREGLKRELEYQSLISEITEELEFLDAHHYLYKIMGYKEFNDRFWDGILKSFPLVTTLCTYYVSWELVPDCEQWEPEEIPSLSPILQNKDLGDPVVIYHKMGDPKDIELKLSYVLEYFDSKGSWGWQSMGEGWLYCFSDHWLIEIGGRSTIDYRSKNKVSFGRAVQSCELYNHAEQHGHLQNDFEIKKKFFQAAVKKARSGFNIERACDEVWEVLTSIKM